MDTSVRKWTEHRWLKITALVLSVLFFMATAATVFHAWQQTDLFGEIVFYSSAQKKQLSFTETAAFCAEFEHDLEIVAGKTGHYANRALQQYLQTQMEEKAAQFANRYNNIRSDFIRSYLFESLCQEDIYENYASYFVTDAQVSVPQITIEKRVLVDAYAPEFVQKVQKILNGTDGTGFLRYEGLIPTDIFAQQHHTADISIPWNEYVFEKCFTYTLDLADPTAYFASQYQQFSREIDLSSFTHNELIAQSIHYYISNPNTKEVFTNTDYTEAQWKAFYQQNTVGFSIVSGELRQKGLEYAQRNLSLSENFDGELDVYVTLDTESANSRDKYVLYKAKFDQMISQDFDWVIVFGIIMAVLSVAFLILLLLCTQNKCVITDKVPLELHMTASVVIGTAILYIGAQILAWAGNFFFDIAGYNYLILWGFLLLAALGWMVVCELLCTVVRICKAGRLSQHLLICRLGRWIGRQISVTVATIIDVFGYQPGAMRRYMIPLVALWGLVNVLLILLMAFRWNVIIAIIFILLQCLVIIKIIVYMQQLDRIIFAAQQRQFYDGDPDALPASLRALVQSQKYTQDELDRAIEQAIKDERTKAELITNVSHDLKTPLTSVINYIDLLQRCDMPDRDAKGYLDVLAEKSGRLKRLIEDLIEASKVTTGNITLQKALLSLNELANQAIVEESEALEGQHLNLVYTALTDPKVFVDGSKIYRVLENLLTNACKYSLQGTRVYASVYEDEQYGYFELKNTSREQLDISPQELTERFVRGDRSRSAEGNGLGLSIAADLCRLNGGELILSIDGDLFKAIVKLPKN